MPKIKLHLQSTYLQCLVNVEGQRSTPLASIQDNSKGPPQLQTSPWDWLGLILYLILLPISSQWCFGVVTKSNKVPSNKSCSENVSSKTWLKTYQWLSVLINMLSLSCYLRLFFSNSPWQGFVLFFLTVLVYKAIAHFGYNE